MSPPSSDTGRLLAVSIGLPREVDWQGEKVRTGIFKAPVEAPVEAGPLGLAGDGQADLRVHGGLDKAIYAFDEASTAYWRESLGRPDLGPGAFGENLTVAGFPDDSVHIGDRFRIGEAEFEVSQPRQPCVKLGIRFEDPTLPKRFFESGRVGYYLRVVEAGRIEAGDEIRRIAAAPEGMDIRTLVAIWLDREAPRESLERAVALQTLAEAWRAPLRKRLARRSTLPS